MRLQNVMEGTVACVALGLGLFVASPAFAQAESDWDLAFEMRNEFRVKMGDYVLPAGEYRLEQMDQDARTFVLYDDHEPADRQPIAMLDVWRVPSPVIADEQETEVRFEIKRDPSGVRMPVLQGWTISGERWKIRDVIETEGQSILVQVFS